MSDPTFIDHVHALTTADQRAPITRKTRGTQPQPIEAATLSDALLKVQTVTAITGLSASTIFRKTAAGQFPEPIRLGTRCTRWNSGRVRAWLAAQDAAVSE